MIKIRCRAIQTRQNATNLRSTNIIYTCLVVSHVLQRPGYQEENVLPTASKKDLIRTYMHAKRSQFQTYWRIFYI